MPFIILLIITVLLLGSISPLLTFTALFQLKEWRFDRLREHLRREGWIPSLFGRIRLWTVLPFFLEECIYFIAISFLPASTDRNWVYGLFVFQILVRITALITFALLSVAQMATRKQRWPVWTNKAKAVAGIAVLLNLLTYWALPVSPVILVLLPLLQPLYVLAAWSILLPLDHRMKGKLMQRATAHRSLLPNTTVIGIAGSVGKTTTKELLHHLLQDLHPVTTPSHVNTEMGVAQWLLNERPDPKSPLIIEMGAYRLGEIALLCSIAQPTIGVVTAIGSDHLALFGSEDAIREANGELVRALPKNGHAFLNGENTESRDLAAWAACPVTVTEPAKNVRETEHGLTLVNNGTEFTVPLHGVHNASNVQLAVAVARHLGINDKRIAELLKSFKPTAHTFNVRTEQGVTLLDDTYNISPLSLRAALDWAAARSERPRILLTSGLQETGSAEEHFLRELGERAKDSVERVIFTVPHGTHAFANAYGDVEILSRATSRVAPGSVLLCVGRMPLSTIQRLLPQ